MGRPKGLVEIGGVPLLRRQLARFAEASAARAVVVVGHDAEAYRAAFPELSFVVSPSPELGPFRSLQAGIDALSSRDDWLGCFVLPVDVPAPEPSAWGALAHSVVAGALVARPTFDGRRGHPVALSQAFAQSLLDIDPAAPDARLDHQIARLPHCVVDVPVRDQNILVNLNDPDALARWLARQNIEST